jgi:phage recombination protein Bet
VSTATQTRPTTTTVEREAPNKDAALLNQMLDREVEYTPFMAKESIKLSARMVLRFLCTPTRSGQVCSERDAMKFIMLCKARGLNPWEGDAYIVGYDGKDGPQFSLITAHQAFLKRAETHPEYDGMDSGVIVKDAAGEVVNREGDLVLDDDQTLVGGWATIHFKNRKHPMKKRLKLSTFSTGRSRWEKDPAGMIVKCAEADALRSAFPNSLGGMYLEGEFPAIEMESRELKPAAPPTGRVNLKPVKTGTNGHHSPARQPEPEPTPEAETFNQEPDRQPGEDPVEEPAQNDDALRREALLADIRDAFKESQCREDLEERVGQRINRDVLGEDFQSIWADYQARWRALPQRTPLPPSNPAPTRTRRTV